MELHENLYQLGLSFGRDVFDDADGLRAALDDFLDEGAASTGDINLLVDAVRLGSFRWMVSTIDSGAEPARAIESAGDLLARDRGSADVAGSRWACAVLGFAVGKVTDTDVRRYRTQGPPPPPQAQPPSTSPAPPPMTPTMVPPPAAPTGPGAPGTQLAGQPAQDFSAPPPAGPSYPAPPQAPVAWSGQPTPPQPEKKKKGLLPLLIGAGIGLVILAVVFGVLQLTGDGEDPGAGPDDPGSSDTVEVTEPDDLDFAAINERYSALGNRVTTGQSGCVEGELLSGQTEALDCTFPQGTLTLTTYETLDELNAARARQVNTDVGGRYAEDLRGVFFSFAPEGASPTLYWDDTIAQQSGFYEASSADVEVAALASVFRSVGSQVKYPEGMTDPDLIDFADLWVRPNQCERIQTLARGELEESLCKARKQIQVYVGKMETKADLIAYRQTRLRDSRRDGLILNPPDWTYGDGPVEGRLADSYAEGDRVLRYWDLNACLCYMEAYYPTNDLTALTDWWTDPRPQG
jgi:hypothetical protein